MEKRTTVGEMKPKATYTMDWRTKPKKRPGEDLMKNLAVASALMLCAVALRSGALPGASGATDAVLASASDDTLLDDRLGKLSFVSSMFPEATLVFGEQSGDLVLPVSGGAVVHAWSEAEPYMAWRTASQEVRASGDGVVMGVYHGENEELLVQVQSPSGMTCVYGNLSSTDVATGDAVQSGAVIGQLMAGEDCVFELRVNGRSVDPAAYWSSLQ